MLKPKKTAVLFAIVSIALMAMVRERSSSGAPASHTGAPGEKTCATAGCHDDNAINSGTAALAIDMGTIAQYTPNKTYPIKVRITDPGVNRFGFQIVALKSTDNTNIGTFELVDNKQTQIVRNQYELSERRYVTYTFEGTDAIYNGMGEWIVNWIAPTSNMGAVTFYASAVSGNDDGIDKGDHVYTSAKTITGE